MIAISFYFLHDKPTNKGSVTFGKPDGAMSFQSQNLIKALDYRGQNLLMLVKRNVFIQPLDNGAPDPTDEFEGVEMTLIYGVS